MEQKAKSALHDTVQVPRKPQSTVPANEPPMYDEFIATLDKLGLREYDAYVNIAVQQNAAEIALDLKTAQPN